MTRILTTTLLATAGAALVLLPTRSEAVTYTDGDLFLGFRASGGTGATQTYLVNIGQASTYRDAASGSALTLSIGNIGLDLAAIYGSTWYTRADLFWGVAGALAVATGADPNHTLYASRESVAGSTLATSWTRRSNSAQTTTETKIAVGLVSGFLNDQEGSSDTHSNFAVIQNTSDPNNWTYYQPGGSQSTGNTSFAVWTPTIEGTFANGASNAELDLFRMTPNSTANTLGSYEGTFTIAQNGAVTFSVVPEPSTAAMLCLSTAFLAFGRRRRAAAMNA